MTDSAHDAILALLRENPPERYRSTPEDWAVYVEDLRTRVKQMEPLTRMDRLTSEVLNKGGVWTGKMAMQYLHSIGFYCTLQRARNLMEQVATQEPTRVRVAEGHRWVWEVL